MGSSEESPEGGVGEERRLKRKRVEQRVGAKVGRDKERAQGVEAESPCGGWGWGGGARASLGHLSRSGSAAFLAHLSGSGEGTAFRPRDLQSERLPQNLGLQRRLHLPPPAVRAQQVKGCDAGAQVSSSSPEPGGVGARTSGSGECPFGDVMSPSAAPRSLPASRSRCPRGRAPDALLILRCAAPVRPHLPVHR